MINQFTPSERVEQTSTEIAFYKDGEIRYSFSADDDGNLQDSITPEARANFDACMQDDSYVMRLVERTESYRRPASGICHCGEGVDLSRFTNTCFTCGRDYNMSGQELAPRSQWGEETGEHWTECY